jgi:hypothetical protein
MNHSCDNGTMTTYQDYVRVLTAAAPQHGVVTRAQILRLSITASSLHRMTLDEDGLVRLDRGIYGVPPLFDSLLEQRVAWWILNPREFLVERARPGSLVRDGVISHGDAAWLHGASDMPTDGHWSVAVPRDTPWGIQHVASLEPGDITWVNGLPVTTLERTTRDLGAVGIDGEHLARWVRFLVTERHWSLDRVADLLGPDATRDARPFVDTPNPAAAA